MLHMKENLDSIMNKSEHRQKPFMVLGHEHETEKKTIRGIARGVGRVYFFQI